MAAFRYEALDAAGRTVSGLLQADTARHARTLLRGQGLLPAEVNPVGMRAQQRRPWAPGIPSAELALLTRQLATLLDSGLTIEQSLTALIEEATDPVTRETVAGVRAEVIAGLTFAGALGFDPRSFPEYYRALVRAGEESGALPAVLQYLADFLEARQALKQKTSLALVYPALVTLVAIAVVSGLMIFVVPQVVQVFHDSRQSVPFLTRALIAVSDFLQTAWPWLAAAVVIVAGGAHLSLRNEGVRRSWHAFLLRLPGIGPVVLAADSSRFASTVAMLVRGGVPLLPALESGTRVLNNLKLREAVERATERVREGASLARALRESQAFSPLLAHLVASGEASGNLARMLERAARLENLALERRLSVFLTLFEPAMILAMGGVVLLIVLAILLPIIQINQLVR